VLDQDETDSIVDRVKSATENNTLINISGGNTKSFLGRSGQPQGQQSIDLNTASHCGVVSYEPTELVVTVRTGTRMADLVALLSDNGQMLPFEPPIFENGTVGGVLACALSGPARPFAGSVRDYVLGMRVINGQAQALRFGGEVMKNVAGYDAARLHVGAYGTLGVLLETSFKVLPLPEAELTVRQELDSAFDNSTLVAMMRQPLPISAAVIDGTSLVIRLSGSESAVNAAARIVGGDVDTNGSNFWNSIRELEHAFFNDDRPLWRLSVPDFTSHMTIEGGGDWLYDWAGAQRYLKTDATPQHIFAAANDVHGHASCYTPDKVPADTPLFQPLEGAMRGLQERVRDSFDKHRLFNRGRFHPELDEALNNTPVAEA